MKKYIMSIMLLMIVATLSLAMAGDFNINYGGAKIFTVATNGTMIAQNVSVIGKIVSAGNISTSNYFVGDGRFLTNIAIPQNSTKLDYHNITSIPTCPASTFLKFDGTDLSCVGVTISGENITSGTIAEARLPSTIYTIGINASQLTVGTIPFARLPSLVNTHTLDYHNITGIPTCGAGTFLKFDGTDLSCVASSAVDYTNLAWVNQSNTFAQEQVFSEHLNVTMGVRLMSNSSVITRAGIETTNISIDSNGNVIINLG